MKQEPAEQKAALMRESELTVNVTASPAPTVAPGGIATRTGTVVPAIRATP